MLNFVYYPVSFILWCWHGAVRLVLGPASATGWALSIVLLVFTLRAILLNPAIRQSRAMRRMQALAPQITRIRQRHPHDRNRQAAEIRRLQQDNGVGLLAGLVPALVQVPVFIGLGHVLRTFTQHPHQPNYAFSLADVHSYLAATLFDAHLGDAIVGTGLMGAGHASVAWSVAPVAIPLMIIAAVATHLTARLSARHAPPAPGSLQSTWMRRLGMWVFPLGVLVFGGLLPVGLLIYWVSNNIWTLGQQHYILGRMAREDAEQRRRTDERRAALAPRPGRPPATSRKRTRHA